VVAINVMIASATKTSFFITTTQSSPSPEDGQTIYHAWYRPGNAPGADSGSMGAGCVHRTVRKEFFMKPQGRKKAKCTVAVTAHFAPRIVFLNLVALYEKAAGWGVPEGCVYAGTQRTALSPALSIVQDGLTACPFQ